MSLIKRNKIPAALCVAALLISSSAATAAPKSVDPWLALSAMSASSASAASAQSDVGVAARSNAGFSAPPLAALAIILGTIAVGLYIALDTAGHGRPAIPA